MEQSDEPVTDADRIAAAAQAVLPEMRELILAGKADHHAEPWARHREQGRADERAAIVAWMLACPLSETRDSRQAGAQAGRDMELASLIEARAHMGGEE